MDPHITEDTKGVFTVTDTHKRCQNPTWQFWDSFGVKLESLCNFSIVVCQWTCQLSAGTITPITSETWGVKNSFFKECTKYCYGPPLVALTIQGLVGNT